jgi:7,8-dihydropterin-6-yl-methyl-4-(beta-D-ribofuranosyl)aminobenzene 5'-phosphate synthase
MRQDIMITIVYDDHPLDKRLQTGFGFACVIRGLPDTILFDTGGRGELLLSNMAARGIKPEQVDSVVLSHAHGDHAGGLRDFLQAHRQVKVFLPRAFPSGFKQEVRPSGAKVVETERPYQVCQGAWTTGVLKRGIEEQGLYLTTSKGLVVITGCAHPGVVNMAEAARCHAGKQVFAVLGGFHMGGASVEEIQRVVRDLREMGVQQVAPCHCSGDKTRRLMKEAFGEGYLPSGVGAQFAFGKLLQSENPESRGHAQDRAF